MLATDKNLDLLRQYIKDTNASNGTNDKLEVLKNYKSNEFLQKVFFYTYHPFYQFRVTVANLKKNINIENENVYGDDLFKLLDDLHLCKITGHHAIGAVNGFIKDHYEYKQELYYIIDRNLETRVTTTSINKIIEGLIPEFDVALCEDYDKQVGKKHQPDFEKEKWFESRKLDGCRAIAVVDADGSVKFLSRAGNEFLTLENAAIAIKAAGFKNVVLDGEICLIKEDGSDDFQGIMKEIKRKNHTIKNVKYKIFDILTPEEFYSKKSTVTFSERLERLKKYQIIQSDKLDRLNDKTGLFNTNSKGTTSSGLTPLEVLKQTHITSQAHFEEIRNNAAEQGWEGTIIRKDTFYEGKRSKNMLKVKNFKDAEYVVIDTIHGPFRVIADVDPEDSIDFKGRTYGELTKEELDLLDKLKKEQTEIMLSAVIIKHKGCNVKVGSGFSISQRREYYKDSSKIIGKEITVKYFEESVNQHGEYSLRFPTVKAIHEGKRDI